MNMVRSLLVLLLVVVACNAFGRSENIAPSALSEVDAVHVVASCDGKPYYKQVLQSPEQVSALLSEFEALRKNPEKPAAAKFSCKARVSFLKAERSVATFHVLSCSMYERAEIQGKRYFHYKAGLNQLPFLRRLLGRQEGAGKCA